METPLLNPWFSMWLHPRQTIRQIVSTNPDRLVVLLAAVGGIAEALTNAASDSKGDDISLQAILLTALFGGPIMGIVGLWLGGLLLRWTGGWLGGQADTRSVRTALAWANVPLIWSLLLWGPALLFFGAELFTTATPAIDASSMFAGLYLVFTLGIGVVSLWALVAFFHALGEVQGFSAWKALGNSILAGLVVAIPLLVLALAMVWISRL